MATEKKGAKKKPRRRKPALTGSPIIIDGGSLDINFTAGEFHPPSGGSFSNRTAGGISRIKLSGSVNQDIQITGKVRIIIFPK